MKAIYKILAAMAILMVAGTHAASAVRSADTSAPAFPGGTERLTAFIDSVRTYPTESAALHIEGVVEVSFTVAPDGSHSGYRIVRPIDPYLEKEALRVASLMPKWIPATADGIPVEAEASIQVIFTLPDKPDE